MLLDVIALAAWALAAWTGWRTCIVEPREMRERFAFNRAGLRLGAAPRHPGALWPGTKEWFGNQFLAGTTDWRAEWRDVDVAPDHYAIQMDLYERTRV